MKLLLNSRFIFFSIFAICAGSLASAFFLEYVLHWEPCVLCWVQRVLFALTGIVCLIATLHNPTALGRRLYALLALIFSTLGVLAAARQIWLKFAPANVGCLPTTIEDIFANNPIFDAILQSFKGTPECGLFQGAVLGIELPVWGVILFSYFTLILLFQLIRKNPTPPAYIKGYRFK